MVQGCACGRPETCSAESYLLEPLCRLSRDELHRRSIKNISARNTCSRPGRSPQLMGWLQARCQTKPACSRAALFRDLSDLVGKNSGGQSYCSACPCASSSHRCDRSQKSIYKSARFDVEVAPSHLVHHVPSALTISTGDHSGGSRHPGRPREGAAPASIQRARPRHVDQRRLERGPPRASCRTGQSATPQQGRSRPIARLEEHRPLPCRFLGCQRLLGALPSRALRSPRPDLV